MQHEQKGVRSVVIVRHSDIYKNILLLNLSGILVKYTYGISALVHCYKFNVFFTVYRDISLQYEPTGCTVYFQFLSVISLYMFRSGLLLITRRYYPVYAAVGICHGFRSSPEPVNILVNAWHTPTVVSTE